ncbi:MAG: HAD family phosphatase [Planctomycetaceae bacterium]|nr:HAD family phosphatase [Planctomycetaceae bacterium]
MTESTIEAVIFDLGRVLVAIDDHLLVERLFKGLDPSDPQQVALATMKDPAMVAFNSGDITPEEFYERMKRRYRLAIEFDEFSRLWCGIFHPMQGMEELVSELGGKVRLGLLSDTDPLHWNFILRNYPWIAHHFKSCTLSYKLGVMKPNPAIYMAAAASVQSPPDRCLYIDDLEDNVLAARLTGMTALRFESVPQLRTALKDLGI